MVIGFAIQAHLVPWAHTVYDIYAPAARNWWAGRDLYVRGTDYFRYSPLMAIAFSPFGLLPDCWGGPLWKVCNCLVFAGGLWTWSRRVLPVRLSRSQTGVLFLLVLPCSVHSLYIGQANALMVGALLFGLAAATGERWNQAAAWLALATLIKGYPLALGLLLSALYPRRFAARFVAALGIGLLLPFAAQWPSVVVSQYASWSQHLLASTAIMRERLRSIDHLLDLCHLAVSPQAFAELALLAGLVVLSLALAARRSANPRELLTQVWGLFAFWVVLFGPATESCTYIVVAPTIAWSILKVFQYSARWGPRLAVVGGALMMGPLVTDMFGPIIRNFANEHGSQPVGALLFLAYLIAEGHGDSKAAPAAETPLRMPRASAA
jgi:hypothetical protein